MIEFFRALNRYRSSDLARRALTGTLCCLVLSAAPCATMAAPTPNIQAPTLSTPSPQAILHDLKRLQQMGSVLYIAAHPDDENTELLAYLARGRNYRTAYLSLTRGDGGQNVLGADLGSKLGMARTQELMAARQIDGAQQFFSRAIDFGFSKNYIETLKVWDKDAVLSDVVRVIRQFKPDILITRFATSPGGTHGHHTASAVLAKEAFALAGDPKAYPDQIKQGLEPWQPKRVIWNTSRWQKEKIDPKAPTLKILTDGKDAITGESFVDIAERSRSMHKTQGFDQFKLPIDPGPRTESFQHISGDRAETDIMDGIDTSWARIKGGEKIGTEIEAIIASYDLKDPAASVDKLFALRKDLAALAASDSSAHSGMLSVIHEKQRGLDTIIQHAIGLRVETTIAQADVVPGDEVQLTHTALIEKTKESDKIHIQWLGARLPEIEKTIDHKQNLVAGQPASFTSKQSLPSTALLEQPWWLRVEGTAGLVEVDDPKLIGTAVNAPTFPIIYRFKINGQSFDLADFPVHIKTAELGTIRQPLAVISPISLHLDVETLIATAGQAKTITVEATAARAPIAGTLRLEAPAAWHITPASTPIAFDKIGESKRYTFTIQAPDNTNGCADWQARIIASAKIKDVEYKTRRETVTYSHLPTQILHAPAAVRAVKLDLVTSGTTVGFIPGAGESLPEQLQQMGYKVIVFDKDKPQLTDLQKCDAIILGVRAFNVRQGIDSWMPLLMSYVEQGGTLIAQYNRPDKLMTQNIAPYKLTISSGRVTDETAPMKILEPASPILNTPNKLTKADFDGWVQERGLYFAGSWDEHFKPILACNDADEAPLQGGLLVAPYGKGHYIYTGLSLFRQLPAGVPGAYRLLANMIALGAQSKQDK